MGLVDFGSHLYPTRSDQCMLCFGTFGDRERAFIWDGPERIYCHGGCLSDWSFAIARDAWELSRDVRHGEITVTSSDARHERSSDPTVSELPLKDV